MTNNKKLEWEERLKEVLAKAILHGKDPHDVARLSNGLETFISTLLQAQRLKDKERLLEEMGKLKRSTRDMESTVNNRTVEDIKNLINKIL